MSDPNVLVGTNTADDAAVYRLTDSLAVVQTLDFFTPVVDDPYWFGAISAANSLSDIWAMGAKPLFALNLIGFPKDTLPFESLGQILKGGSDKATEAGVPIIGGHSIDDPEPKYGLSVTGIVHPDDVLTNATAQVGDDLILTKPLGSGIINTAIKRGKAASSAIERVVQVMSTLNKAAGEAVVEVGVNSLTDVTGFGLLGHLREMTTGSNVGARIHLSQVPILPDAKEYVAEGICPGGTRRNHEFLGDGVAYAADITEAEQLLLCDAQTSGGLLIAVPEHKTADLIDRLKQQRVMEVAVIGKTVEDPEGRVEVVR